MRSIPSWETKPQKGMTVLIVAPVVDPVRSIADALYRLEDGQLRDLRAGDSGS